MDNKNFLNESLTQARKIAHAAQQAGETAFSFGKQKIQDGKDLLRKKKETAAIIDEATARYHRAVALFEQSREDCQEEAARLDTLEQDIIRHEFLRFNHLYQCAVNHTLQMYPKGEHNSPVFEIPSLHKTESIPSSAKGIAVGGATAATAVGWTALFGTASTGAAISGLHGSAAIGATLASLGGGSLAAGGLGIIGGIAVAASAFVVPAIAAGTYFWGKDIEKDYA